MGKSDYVILLHRPTTVVKVRGPGGSAPCSDLSPCNMRQGRSQEFKFGGLEPMASAEREPITGVWGRSPQRAGSRGRAPGGGSGGEAPLKLKPFTFPRS